MATTLDGEDIPLPRALGSHESAVGGTDEWLTPPHLIDRLGPFDLDPCSPVNRPWPTAARHYTVKDDGLRQDWDGFVWMNPPYDGGKIGTWLARLADHGTGLALVAARTETRAWHEHIWPRCTGALFLRGRLRFCYENGKPASSNFGAPSMLVAYGDLALHRLRAVPDLGWLLVQDPCGHDARDLPGGGVQDAKSGLGEAVAWVRAYLLQRGGAAPAGEAIEAARADGIAERTLQRARAKCGVATSRSADGWVWSLSPSQDDKTPTTAHAHDLWRLGALAE
jgi:DNA N-6-adenine-methyltransferase (Dam)